MSDFQEFLLKNVNLLILLAFVFAPMILKALAKSRERASRRKSGEIRMPEGSAEPVKPEKTAPSKRGEDLESKIRSFFEELTGDSSGAPKSKKPRKPLPEERTFPGPEPEPRYQAGPAPEPAGAGVDTPAPPFIGAPSRRRRKPESGAETPVLEAETPVLEATEPEPVSLLTDIAPVKDPYALKRSPREPETPRTPEDPHQVDIPWDSQRKRRQALVTRKELSGSNLRRAIILREILDVPVSLR